MPRLSIRTMMVLVALLAIGLGVEKMRRLRVRALELASYHAALESAHRELADLHAATAARVDEEARDRPVSAFATPSRAGDALAKAAARDREDEREDRAKAESHAALRRKYERAARYPFLPVEPDPR